MDEAEHHLPAAQVEQLLLAALCAPALSCQTRTEIVERLAVHKFVYPEYEVIFRALAKMRHATAEHIRETLGAQLTRMGFPDIDVELIFELAGPAAAKVKTLLQQLNS